MKYMILPKNWSISTTISCLKDWMLSGNPTVDPHGDPIPDKDGNIQYHEDVSLDQLEAGQQGIIVGVTDHSTDFLQYLEKMAWLSGRS